MSFGFPTPDLEVEILVGETRIAAPQAARLVRLAGALRSLKDHDLEEAASTRLLVYAALLIESGMDEREACRAALAEPLTDDGETISALVEVIDASLA
jgi:nitric oxide reductase NorQ protein